MRKDWRRSKCLLLLQLDVACRHQLGIRLWTINSFGSRSDQALSELYDALVDAGDEHDFEADLAGALTVEFNEPPAKFVVSPNSPVKQIWVSAQMKSYKLDWDQRAEALSCFPKPGRL